MNAFNGLLIVFSLLLCSACSDVSLVRIKRGPSEAQGKGQFCISPPTEINVTTKILFVVDKSYSNQVIYLPGGDSLPGTDPGAVKRGGAIDFFVQEHAGRPHFRYGLVAFQEDYGQSYITDTETGLPGFTPEESIVYQATQALRENYDNGETPYLQALQMALQVVQNDANHYRDERATYHVFFLSDGIPTVGQEDEQIFALVEQLKNAGTLNLSTGFYGDYGDLTEEAKQRLREMARIGGGKFIDFNDSSHWDLDDFLEEPTFEPWFLSKFMVYNINAGFCRDGKVDADSDGDGLCDRDENELSRQGFDPANRFTFGDGYGDYFHWRRFKYGESLPPCRDRSDEDHDLLTACEEKYIRNDDASDDVGKSGHIGVYDTDRDGVLDGIETFVYFVKSLAFAMDETNLTTSFDGEEPAGYQIAQHRSPLIEDRHALSYDTELIPVTEGNLDCVRFQQKLLPVYPTLAVPAGNTLPGLEHGTNTNRVMAYYIQKPQRRPKDDGVLRYTIQGINYDPILKDFNKTAGLLRINDEVFSTYVPPLRAP